MIFYKYYELVDVSEIISNYSYFYIFWFLLKN